MAPRRMDGFGRSAGQPAPRPAQPRPTQPRPAQVPMRPQPAARPMPEPDPRRAASGQAVRASQPVRRPAMAHEAAATHEPTGDAFGLFEPEAKPKRGGAMAVVAQFVIGLLIIVGVAALVVWLWMKYYQS